MPLGDLMCRLQKVNQTDAAGSAQTRNIDCVYQPSKGGVEEFYAGTLSTIGLYDPLKNKSLLAWVIRGPKNSGHSAGCAGADIGGRNSRRSSAVFGWRYANVHHPFSGFAAPRCDTMARLAPLLK